MSIDLMVDAHVHSNFSDGRDHPATNVAIALGRGLKNRTGRPCARRYNMAPRVQFYREAPQPSVTNPGYLWG